MTKKKLLAPLFLAASFLIVGCSTSEIIARPSWVDDPIVINPETGDPFKDNTLKEIYDAIKKLGDTNANVLNKVMYDVAQKHIGHYEDVTDENGNVVEVGLKSIVNGTATDEQFKKFVEDPNHKIYAPDKFGYKKGSEDVEELTTDEQKHANSLAKITNQFNRIQEDICKKLFDEIKGGSYSTKIDKFFEEDYFIEHLYKEMYYEGEIPTTGIVKDAVFFPKKANETWVEYVDGRFLHVFNDDGTFTDYYKGYINRKVLPEIYRTLLIENYVHEQRYTNLGRSYARKVNMITIPKNSDVPTDNNINQTLIEFATNKLIGDKPETNFEVLTNAMVGFASVSETAGTESMKETYKLLNPKFRKLVVDGHDFVWGIVTDEKTGHAAEGDLQSTYVYYGTKLYDIVDKYLKINNVKYVGEGGTPSYKDFAFYPKEHLTSDEQAAYDDLTNKHAYTVEKGLEIKEREIRLTDMTTDGWFLKSSGVSGLGQEFSDKLFNITTARLIDDEVAMEKEKPSTNDTVRYFGKEMANKKAFVYDSTKTADAESIVLNDGTNHYILEVEEAASASKLSMDEGKDSYLGLKATDTLGESNDAMNEIISKIVEQVANSDTYKKNAEQYYLMISNIVFYDQSVYDYFKSQFPDLFK